MWSPDQGLIQSYTDLVLKYGELRRAIHIMRTDIESVARNIEDFWIGDDETKKFVVEKLRTALATKVSFDL